jgi:hypothetical protein
MISHNREKRVLVLLRTSVRLSVSPSVRMYQRGSHWMDFRGILYCGLYKVFPETQKIWSNSERMSDTLHDYLSTFYCHQRYEFAIKVFLFNTQ